MKKDLILNIGLMAAALLICFLALEVFLRFYDPFDYTEINSERFDPYEDSGEIKVGELRNLHQDFPMTKNLRMKFQGNMVKLPETIIETNNNGFRDYEYPKKHAGFRIICLGDSVTFGQGVNLEDTFPKILEKKLQKITDSDVLNMGVVGYATIDELRLLEEIGLDYNPDMIVLTIMANDHKSNLIDHSMLTELQKGLAKSESSYALRWIKDSIQIYKDTVDYNAPDDEKLEIIRIPLESIRDICTENGIELLVLLHIDSYFMKPMLDRMEIEYIDLSDVFQDMSEKDYLLAVKNGKVLDAHFNPFGHEMVAKTLIEEIEV